MRIPQAFHLEVSLIFDNLSIWFLRSYGLDAAMKWVFVGCYADSMKSFSVN